jgi:DNA recombination protein RmuC
MLTELAVVFTLLIAIATLVVLIGLYTHIVRNPIGDELHRHFTQENRALREDLDAKLDRLRDSHAQQSDANRDAQQRAITGLSGEMQEALHRFLRHTSDSLEKIRAGVDAGLTKMQESNEKKLDEMRLVVNEKLEKTLEARLHQSFAAVSTQLESVNKGLGEMKSVAQSVGSLNRILSGSKSRGILGEVQLGHIIEDMLPSQLYEREFTTKPGSSGRVEYAVKLPGAEDGRPVYLPIDSKFPLEAYERLLDGYENGDAETIEAARKELHARIRVFAKDVKAKYVSPPETTPFAVLFLPTEGLYAEVARDAVFFDGLRQEGIIVTGPTTFSAMLGSLQLGFKTLQIQKGAADIEKTLGAVKKEFANFETVLTKAQQKITQAGNDLENLVGTRSRAISRSLREVQVYTGDDAPRLLGMGEAADGDILESGDF